jgi:chemotaxis response regulator CheB
MDPKLPDEPAGPATAAGTGDAKNSEPTAPSAEPPATPPPDPPNIVAPARFPIVGIGASARGLEALEEVLLIREERAPPKDQP